MAKKKEPDFLEGVARVANGPKIFSRWGFRKIELNGETVLLAMSEDELRSQMVAAGRSRVVAEQIIEEARSDVRFFPPIADIAQWTTRRLALA